jgi:hypothetical protein
VKHPNPPADPSSNADWQILAHFHLPACSSIDSTLSTWLHQTLGPLNLHAVILDKISKSTLTATLRAKPPEAEIFRYRFHLVVLLPVSYSEQGQNWGFYLVEKFAVDGEIPNKFFFEIELYLYQEG